MLVIWEFYLRNDFELRIIKDPLSNLSLGVFGGW